MTEDRIRERSLSSEDGLVTVSVAAGTPPRIELAKGAERMFARDLADLVTATARAAADAARADAPEPTPAPTIDDALSHLKAMREDLTGEDWDAALEKRSQAMGSDLAAARSQGFTGPLRLAMPDIALTQLQASIDLLERFKHAPPGAKKSDQAAMPVGKAKSPSGLVTVEATPDYPVAAVVLSRHACEIGPKQLGKELTETAEAAAADLAARQSDYFSEVGLPLGPEDLDLVRDELKGRGDLALKDIDAIRAEQARLAKLVNEGGYLA